MLCFYRITASVKLFPVEVFNLLGGQEHRGGLCFLPPSGCLQADFLKDRRVTFCHPVFKVLRSFVFLDVLSCIQQWFWKLLVYLDALKSSAIGSILGKAHPALFNALRILTSHGEIQMSWLWLWPGVLRGQKCLV